VGPEAGIRFRLGQRVALRTGFWVSWSQVFLFFTHQDVGDVRYERSERVNLVRYDLAVSLETWL
jgi:hypothetical protein